MICQKNPTQLNLQGSAEKPKAMRGLRLQDEMESSAGGQRRIPLTQGLFAVIDASDFGSISGYIWHAVRLGRRKMPYAKRVDYSAGRKNRKQIFLHHSILGGATMVDHKNGNTLDCTRGNLRPCSKQENTFNRTATTKQNGKATKYKGICWHKRKLKWQASIGLNREKIHIGYFDSETQAAEAYDKMAIELFGKFSATNFHY